jgi:hypothetical protein
MTTQEMRAKLVNLLINHNYGSVRLAKDIGIDYKALIRFLDGLCRTNRKTMMKIERFVSSKDGK